MTALRLISLPVHAAIEMLAGLALMAAPFALGFGPAGLVVSFGLGVLVVGLALSASGDHRGLGISAHFALDRGLAIGLLGGALVLALTGEAGAAAALAVAAIVQSALNLSTRYSSAA